MVGVAGGAAALYLVTGDGDDYPAEWDRRVVDLIRFVERERGLDFDHPVAVDFLSEVEFKKEVTSDEEELTDEEREELDAFEGAFRALGLVRGDVDLFEEFNTLSGEGVAAFYDYDEERIVVRGEELGAGIRVTLVHELTHALQDQHFDLSRLDDEDLTSGEFAAFQALVEGDAVRVEFAYAASLDEEDAREYERDAGAEAEEAEAGIKDVPVVLRAYFGAPYQLGEGLLAVLESEGGNDEIDDSFDDPPTSDEHLISPFTYLDRDEPGDVPQPEPLEGEDEVDRGDFGALTWYLALAERVDPRRALEAVDGWGGDAYLLYEADGRSCVRVVFRGDRARDVDEMESVLDDWVAEMPAGAARVRRAGNTLTLESCDPGADADVTVRGRAEDALALPLIRTFIALGISESGGPRSLALCVAREFIELLSDEQIEMAQDLLFAEEPDPALTELSENAARACGVPIPEGGV